MPIERTIIDLEIIWKKINHSITSEEEMFLAQWLKESPDNQQYFDNALRHYQDGSVFGLSKAETDKAWETLKKKGLKGNQRNFRTII